MACNIELVLVCLSGSFVLSNSFLRLRYHAPREQQGFISACVVAFCYRILMIKTLSVSSAFCSIIHCRRMFSYFNTPLLLPDSGDLPVDLCNGLTKLSATLQEKHRSYMTSYSKWIKLHVASWLSMLPSTAKSTVPSYRLPTRQLRLPSATYFECHLCIFCIRSLELDCCGEAPWSEPWRL